ncbi:general odorant-binding protein 99a-like [Uranotaenia lowii]|uniref:general odorant-binding protein 99a-like n=1 Tax=Uranotaenia lowii TaxID=190385 RepID=UPI00247B2A86|nr:general odorant-binding protein 99a-like [Uranotaenia lowii]
MSSLGASVFGLSLLFLLQLVDITTPEYLVKTDQINREELISTTLECFLYLNLPPERIRLYQRGIFPNDPPTWCLVRCVSLKLGLYSDRHGPRVDQLFRWLGIGGSCRSESCLLQRAYRCVEKKMVKYLDTCQRAYHTMIGCFGSEIVHYLNGSNDRVAEGASCDDCYRMYDELYRASLENCNCNCESS